MGYTPRAQRDRGRELGCSSEQLSACVSPRYRQEQLGPGPHVPPTCEKASSALTGRNTDSVISEKQLDPLLKSDSVCRRFNKGPEKSKEKPSSSSTAV